MHMRVLKVLALAGALLSAVPCALRAQNLESASAGEAEEAAPLPDTLAVRTNPNTDERLMAKVDSLRKSLEEAPERRRQTVGRALAAADSLCLLYDFPSAVDLLGNISSETDSTTSRSVEEALLRGHAGLRMMSRVSRVRTSARKRISKEEFFSMFPGAGDGDEVRFHYASPDGRTLYFSSKDRSGAGGYDLYVSRRDRRTGAWRESVNLGFPYSSPFNDYLYADTGDGLHSVLVSDRDCPEDSVNVYVMVYDPIPPRQAISDARVLRSMAALDPTGDRPVPTTRRGRTTVDLSAYSAKTAAVRAVRDSVSAASRTIDNLREALADMTEDEQENALAEIMTREHRLADMRKRLDIASSELQEIEMAFLAGGNAPASPLSRSALAAPPDSLAAQLFLATEGGRSVMKISEHGKAVPSTVLPEGGFSEYVEFPATPVFRVRAVIPEDDIVPPLALTVIRLHTGMAPEVSETEDYTVYTSAPLNGRTRAESLVMALRATGVTDIHLED